MLLDYKRPEDEVALKWAIWAAEEQLGRESLKICLPKCWYSERLYINRGFSIEVQYLTKMSIELWDKTKDSLLHNVELREVDYAEI
jgi:hypothetical protein